MISEHVYNRIRTFDRIQSENIRFPVRNPFQRFLNHNTQRDYSEPILNSDDNHFLRKNSENDGEERYRLLLKCIGLRLRTTFIANVPNIDSNGEANSSELSTTLSPPKTTQVPLRWTIYSKSHQTRNAEHLIRVVFVRRQSVDCGSAIAKELLSMKYQREFSEILLAD